MTEKICKNCEHWKVSKEELAEMLDKYNVSYKGKNFCKKAGWCREFDLSDDENMEQLQNENLIMYNDFEILSSENFGCKKFK